MPCFYAMPECYTMPHCFASVNHPFASNMHRPFVSSVHHRRAAPCFVPCLAPILALFFLPAIIRLGCMMLFGLMHLASYVIFFMLVASTVRALLHDDNEDGHANKSSSARCPAAACFARMKAHAQQSRAAQTAPGKPESTSESKPESKPEAAKKERRHDLSTARLEPTSEGVNVVVSAPGVAPSDLDVSVLEHSLRIKGETKRGVDVFCVDRHIVPPSHVDVNTAACTHADGEVTVTMTKKVGKRIPVTPAAATPTTADEPVTTDEAINDAATQAAVREVTGEGSESEWEPLA